MTASAGGMLTSFTLQLNAAILGLSINATSVAFGDVVVNTPATQPVTLTSTGTGPVTINEAAVTGAGFTMSGAELPTTLNPSQQMTLNIGFDPTAVGAATGQLVIAGTSSTNGTAVIGLSGTGTSSSAVAFAVTPATASTSLGATQQFAASVTGSPDAAVIWKVSGVDCSGAACGAISSSGLYTAPATVPSSAIVTITATSKSDPTKSASAIVSIVPPQAAGYNLVWEDTFSALNLCTTSVAGCNWYNSGLWYANTAGTVTDPYGTYVNVQWATGQSNRSTTITTASMNQLYYRRWTFGYFEFRMAFNPVAGSWPGIGMYSIMDGPGNDTNNQMYPELDIFEWQSNNPTVFSGTIHVWKNSAMIASAGVTPTPSVDYSQFHTYGVLWTPTTVTWYLDNVSMGSVSITSSPYNEVYNGQQPLFLVLGQQAGCRWVYTCAGQVSPLDMQVQWVHVYQTPSN
jgi:beta-glucanase (GH16 family)